MPLEFDETLLNLQGGTIAMVIRALFPPPQTSSVVFQDINQLTQAYLNFQLVGYLRWTGENFFGGK